MLSERAIVLKTIKHGESDLIVHCLSRVGLRLNLMAKGALKSRRRFGGGVLEPLNYIQISYREARSQGVDAEALHFLEEAHLLQDFVELRQDYDRLELGFYFIQVVSKVVREEASDNSGIFDLLGNALKTLSRTPELSRLRTLFELKLLHQQGMLAAETEGFALLRYPLQQHQEIDLTDEEFAPIRREAHQLLEAYLMN